MRRLLTEKHLIRFIFATFILSIMYTVVRIIISPTIAPSSEITLRVKGDYVLMLLQCMLGALAMMLPGFIKRRVKINIPSAMIIMYALFLYCAVYLGEVRAFYYNVPHWDTVLHTFSGAALGALGFSVVTLLNKSESIAFSLSPVFVALFAFCFAVALGVLWEVYEFSMDVFLHTNAQKYALESGEAFTGQLALLDTMKDLIVDMAGALSVSIIGFISLKYEKGWLERVQLKRVKDSN